MDISTFLGLTCFSGFCFFSYTVETGKQTYIGNSHWYIVSSHLQSCIYIYPSMIYLMILLTYNHWSCEPGTGTQKFRVPSVLPVPSAPGSHVEAKALVILDVGVLSQIVMFPSRDIKMWRATVQSSRWKQETELCTRDLAEGNIKSNTNRFPKWWINQHIRHINLVNSVRLYLHMIIYIYTHTLTSPPSYISMSSKLDVLSGWI